MSQCCSNTRCYRADPVYPVLAGSRAMSEYVLRACSTGVGHCRQVGCPQSGIDDACQRLLAAGYKVGRIEQTETAAEAKAKRGPKVCCTRHSGNVVLTSY